MLTLTISIVWAFFTTVTKKSCAELAAWMFWVFEMKDSTRARHPVLYSAVAVSAVALLTTLAACEGVISGGRVGGGLSGGAVSSAGGGSTAGSAGLMDANPDPGTVVLHRLNRAEYNNTVHDLLGTTQTPADAFPPDGVSGGFDNNPIRKGPPSRLLRRALAGASSCA